MFNKENWTMKNAAFFFILICAIAVSFWGISALLLAAGAPMLVAYAGGLVFDALALWLGHEAVEVALSEESATGHEIITYAVVAASMYLNWLHAELAGMTSVLPYVMALFPLAAGILFHFYLKRQSKKARREQDRLVNRNPVIGRLTWLRYPRAAFRVWSQSVKSNIDRAQTQIPNYKKDEPLQVAASLGNPIQEKPKKVAAPKPQPQLAPAMQLEEPEIVVADPIVPQVKETVPFGFVIPKPEFAATKPRGQAIEAYHMGHTDPDLVASWVGTDKLTVQKYFYAAKQQVKK